MLILDFFGKISVFAFLWLSIFLFHELFHCFEAWRQNHYIDTYIRPFFNEYSIVMYYDGYIDKPWLVHYAGGIYSSFVCFVACVFTVEYAFICWCFLVLGWVQLCYGIFEGVFSLRLSSRDYKIYRYCIYVLVVSIMVIISWWLF